MPPPRYQSVDVGFGADIILSQREAAAVKNVTDALKVMKKEYEAVRKLKKEIKDINDLEIQQAGRLSRADHDRKNALLAIKDLYINLGIAQKGKKKADIEEINSLDIFKKRYSWMLIAFTAIKDIFGVLGRDSKIANTIFDLVGQAVGFIVDMLLIDFLPLMITFVEWLFRLGEWVSGLPTWVKGVILIVIALGAALAAIFAASISIGLASVALSVLGIGTAATTVAGILGTLLGSLTALFAAAAAGLVIGAGTVALAEKYFGVLTKISDAGSDFRKSEFGGGARQGLMPTVGTVAENVLNPMLSAVGAGQILTGEQFTKRVGSGVAYDKSTMEALTGRLSRYGAQANYSAQEGYYATGKTAGGDVYHISISGTYKNEEEVYQKFIEKLSRESASKVSR
jgi:hypothetical protein